MVTRESIGQLVYCLFQCIAEFYESIHLISRNVHFSRKNSTLELKGTHHINKDNIITLDSVMKRIYVLNDFLLASGLNSYQTFISLLMLTVYLLLLLSGNTMHNRNLLPFC